MHAMAQTIAPPSPLPPRPESDLERIFTEHAPRVFRAAQRITGNAADAEDVLQTVFLRLARRETEIDLAPGPASYLYRAAINAALDVVRARKRAAWVPLEEAPPPLALDPASRADSGVERRQSAGALRQALATLPPRAAEMFALRYFEGQSNRDIARLFGTSQGVVAVLLHRTRYRLRKQLVAILGEQP